jgi:hypothetical protein
MKKVIMFRLRDKDYLNVDDVNKKAKELGYTRSEFLRKSLKLAFVLNDKSEFEKIDCLFEAEKAGIKINLNINGNLKEESDNE